MAIADLLAKLVELKSQLVANLSSMGVTADESEKLNTLVPKVLECKTDVIQSKGTVSKEVTSVKIPSGVTSIADSAFVDCESLANITIPDSVTSIGCNAFDCCSSLASITIPDSVTSIGYMAFFCCESLASITIPDSVTSIGLDTFRGCSSLASITIGNGVTSIERDVFYNCSSLANIYYIGKEEQWNAITKDTNWNRNMGSNVEGGTVITYNYTG